MLANHINETPKMSSERLQFVRHEFELRNVEYYPCDQRQRPKRCEPLRDSDRNLAYDSGEIVHSLSDLATYQL